jgi:alkylated DNA repair protein (DNA oxidative demethylase)
MTLDLFDNVRDTDGGKEILGEGAALLRGFALRREAEILAAVDTVIAEAPLRHLITPGGFRMSVAMTNCGAHGWVSDRRGYRYSSHDPGSGKPWPAFPAVFLQLAQSAAAAAGYAGFEPTACLVNRYEPGARLTLHQDKDELDQTAPIVSVSLGIDAIFLFGGLERRDRTQRVPLMHGDVVVWGGPSRLRYHGVMPVKPSRHPLLGECRINLTFRKAH